MKKGEIDRQYLNRTNLTGDIKRSDRGSMNGFSEMSDYQRLESRRAKKKITSKIKTWKHPIRTKHAK